MIEAKPMPGFVYLKTDAAVAGVFTDDTRAVEVAEVISVGEGVESLKAGDRIFIKSWAIDMINHQGEWYKFVNIESKGILAKIHE